MKILSLLALASILACSPAPTNPHSFSARSENSPQGAESGDVEKKPSDAEDSDTSAENPAGDDASKPGEETSSDAGSSNKPDPKPIPTPVPVPTPTPTPTPTPSLLWKKANLTNYESYPDPGSEECLEYNGCTWAGMFAALDGKQSEEWVKANNIIAIHSKDFKMYKLKTLRLKKGTKTIDAKVYDMCSDSDCNNCCTKNAKETGFLIDIEKYTKQRFDNVSDGIIEWACVDCQ